MSSEIPVSLTKRAVITTCRPLTKKEFVKKLSELIKNVIEFLKKNGCINLSHLKLINTTNNEDYLQISVFGIDKKLMTKGFLRDSFEKVKITLNILESGISKIDMERKVIVELQKLKENI